MVNAICDCGSLILQSQRGRPRKFCTTCRPVGPKPKTEKICAGFDCDEKFVTTNVNKKYCSGSCRQSNQWHTAARLECNKCGRKTQCRRTTEATGALCKTCRGNSPVLHGTARMYREEHCRCNECMVWKRTKSRGKCTGTCSAEDCDRPVLGRGLCPSHYSRWHRSQRKYTVICPVCGNTAQVQRKHLRHCSYKCSMKSVAADKRGMTIDEWLLADHKPKRLTAIERAQRRLDKAAKGTRGRSIWVSRTCKICPNSFITQSSSTGTCCSPKCTKDNRRNKAIDAGARRRARKRNAYVAPVKRLEIFRRDKYRCYICKRLTSPKVCVPHPRAPTIDHIIPLAKGGTHEPANVATACFECNCYKRDLGGYEQLALIG